MFSLIKPLIKPLVGTGIGRIKPLAKIYQKLIPLFIGKDNVVEVQGFRMMVSAKGHITDIGTELMFKGVHEPTTTRLFRSLLHQGDIVLDIGANIGYFSLLASTLVGQSGWVIALEPDPANIAALDVNIKLNGFHNILFQEVAVSDHTGVATLYRHKNEDARHSLIKSDHNNSIQVKVDTIDNMVLTFSKHIKLIKTDTEGHDMSVLLGAQKTLEENQVMVITEVYKEMLEASGHSIKNLWNYLLSVGFTKFFLIDDYNDSISICPSSEHIEEIYNDLEPGLNLFCIK